MPQLHTQFDAIGTHWQIDIPDDRPQTAVHATLKRIHQRIAEFDQAYSRFRADSLVTTISKQAGRYRLPADSGPMMSLYQQLYHLTDGLVTPLVGQLLADAGYDAQYSLQVQRPLTPPPGWEETLVYQKPYLTTKKPVLLDFGAAGKGYLVDLVCELLEAEKICNYCVDAGGDIRYRATDNTALRVGLENPSNTKQVIGISTLVNQSICGSAINRRAWGNFNHVMNPVTLQSVSSILATWVVADTTLIADAIATCLFFAPPEILSKEFLFSYLILKSDYSVEKSPNFPAELFTL